MQVNISVYDILVLATICACYLAKCYQDYSHSPLSHREGGPRSPFEEEEKCEDVEQKRATSPPSLSDSSGDLESPAETPFSSQLGLVNGPYSAPAISTRSSTPSLIRPHSRLSNMSESDALTRFNAFVSRILTNDLLYDLILFSVDPCTLVRLARTCRSAHSAVHSHIARTFNINTHLLRYFTDPLAFRSLQARTGMLISGSNALQFLDRTFYPEADLDLYCAYEEREEIGTWLLGQGYRFVPNSRQDPSFSVAVEQARVPGTEAGLGPYSRMKSISAVYTFTKRVNDLDGPSRRLKVQIIVAYNSPMDAIFSFHSTAVLNVISFSHAYSLYPRATFHDRVALALIPRANLDESVEAKYAQRGWRFIHSVPLPQPSEGISSLTGQLVRYMRSGECHECEHCRRRRASERSVALGFPTGMRWIGDAHSWVLPLPTEGVRFPSSDDDEAYAPRLSRDPSYVTSWEMANRKPRHGEVGKKIQKRVVAGDGFWHSYVVSDPKLTKAMAMIQELYLYIPTTEGVADASKHCDEKLIEYCKEMLEDRKLWNAWYPSES